MAGAAGAAGYARVDTGYIFKRRREVRLLRPRGGKGGKRTPRVASEKRHQAFAIEGRAVSLPPLDNAALSEARTLYPSTVVQVEGLTNLLVSGVNSRNIGGQIMKGPAKGFPIFTLTLQERATCPSSCRHWRSCYGNSMHMAKRVQHGPAFEARLEAELAVLQSRHPRGFAVRLHVLGDFYSLEYVQLWAGFLKKYRSLFVFGFTARWQREDPIAVELVQLVMAEWGRFCIRFSNAPVDECSTVSIEHPRQKPDDAIICPAQMQSKTKRGATQAQSCGSCALCWSTRRRIAFLQQ
ncbi:hypothetical protein [Bradyrhizobium sp. 174]|uniref:hypothetical protein n=1 Tax=Bradyrhizobium sp. 174 TaxID=2782645 RepID=UPI001FFB5A96|nr:hypothetical protein [Bradyrhizobium sp. 174]MCK1577850.1 hypothetical protein [Bradyrhizobium sp. 174]